jgi:hypothetical protein
MSQLVKHAARQAAWRRLFEGQIKLISEADQAKTVFLRPPPDAAAKGGRIGVMEGTEKGARHAAPLWICGSP